MGRRKQQALAFWRAVCGPVPAPPPPMTYDQFIAVLSTTPRAWWVTKEGVIRSGDGDCPLTKVCKVVTGRRYSSSGWAVAAEEMRLSKTTAQKICPAADNVEYHDLRVRRDLLVATGLLADPLDIELAALVAARQPQAVEAEESELAPA